MGNTFAALASRGWRDAGGAGETVVHLILRAFQELVMNDMEAIEILEPVLRQFPDAMLAKNAVGVTPTDIALQVQGNSKIIRRYESRVLLLVMSTLVAPSSSWLIHFAFVSTVL